MRLLAAVMSLALLATTAGCTGDDDDDLSCTTEAVASVSLSVEDEVGAVILDADATYSVDGGETHACEVVGSNYVCGWEVAGEFLVTVSKQGYLEAQEEVTVTSGECHVNGQTVEIQLQPE